MGGAFEKVKVWGCFWKLSHQRAGTGRQFERAGAHVLILTARGFVTFLIERFRSRVPCGGWSRCKEDRPIPESGRGDYVVPRDRGNQLPTNKWSAVCRLVNRESKPGGRPHKRGEVRSHLHTLQTSHTLTYAAECLIFCMYFKLELGVNCKNLWVKWTRGAVTASSHLDRSCPSNMGTNEMDTCGIGGSQTDLFPPQFTVHFVLYPFLNWGNGFWSLLYI